MILYLFIVCGIRLLGKRQIGELEPSELVLSLLVADLASVPMQDLGVPLAMGIIPILTLLTLSSLISVLTIKSMTIRNLLCGKPSVVIQDGKLLPRALLKNRLTIDELLEELRLGGYADIARVKCAILETSGHLSILPYAAEQPPVCRQVRVETKEPGLPLVLISDGKVVKKSLTKRGLDSAWLLRQLQSRGIQSAGEVFLLTVDEQNTLYYTRKLEPADR
jgi:uncharacterized membrane protein YcaP (DUF421 family)